MSERIVEKAELPAARTSRNLVAWSLLAGILLWGALAGPFFAGRIYTADDLGAFHLPVRAFYADQLARGVQLHSTILPALLPWAETLKVKPPPSL